MSEDQQTCKVFHEIADLLKLSIQAYTGEIMPETIKTHRTIKGHHIYILIDSGSTNNFLSDRLTSMLQLHINIDHALNLIVANGATLESPGSCTNISWTAQVSYYNQIFTCSL